jgi:signal recognition particle subunit SRP19
MPDHFYVYPAYLEKGIARADGRRVPAAASLEDLTAEEIAQAAKRLGCSAEVEPAKQYPRRFFTYAGRVKVGKKAGTTKAEFLRAVAREIQRQRTQAGRK